MGRVSYRHQDQHNRARPHRDRAHKKAQASVDVPVVAIGGINEENVEPVVKAGADAICVSSTVGQARDPEETDSTVG